MKIIISILCVFAIMNSCNAKTNGIQTSQKNDSVVVVTGVPVSKDKNTEKNKKGTDENVINNPIKQEEKGFKNLSEHIKEYVYKGKKYIVVEFSPKEIETQLFNVIETKALEDFNSIYRNKKSSLIFAMNAGMFNERYYPIGLYTSKGKTYYPLNLKKGGYGNFYSLPPNGVFAIDSLNTPYIIQSDSFKVKTEGKKIITATQSGPMLVIDKEFNKAFNEGSPNLNIRNGVGVNKRGEVIFVISMNKVNFYEFSQLFRDELNCDNALYLDGFVSQWFAPKIHKKPVVKSQLGPIIAISYKEKK